MKETISENQVPIEDLISQGTTLLTRMNTLGTITDLRSGRVSIQPQITTLLASLLQAVPPNDDYPQAEEIERLVFELTSIRRKTGEMLIAYIMRANTEREQPRVYGAYGRVNIRPAFGAPSPDDGRSFSVDPVLMHRDLTKI